MAKMYIEPKTLSFAIFEKESAPAGWLDAATYVEKLQEVIGEIIEDAKDDPKFDPNNKRGFAEVTWISLNKSEKLVKGEY